MQPVSRFANIDLFYDRLVQSWGGGNREMHRILPLDAVEAAEIEQTSNPALVVIAVLLWIGSVPFGLLSFSKENELSPTFRAATYVAFALLVFFGALLVFLYFSSRRTILSFQATTARIHVSVQGQAIGDAWDFAQEVIKYRTSFLKELSQGKLESILEKPVALKNEFIDYDEKKPNDVDHG